MYNYIVKVGTDAQETRARGSSLFSLRDRDFEIRRGRGLTRPHPLPFRGPEFLRYLGPNIARASFSFRFLRPRRPIARSYIIAAAH